MNLIATLRKIRACEGEAAAQLLFEAYVDQAVAAERARWAGVEEYLAAAADGSMSRNNSQNMAAELLAQRRDQMPTEKSDGGFTPAELKLPQMDWVVLARRKPLSPDVRLWVAHWSLLDLALSPMSDDERPLMRYGHYLAWSRLRNPSRVESP